MLGLTGCFLDLDLFAPFQAALKAALHDYINPQAEGFM